MNITRVISTTTGPSYLLSENGDLSFLFYYFFFERVLGREHSGKVSKKFISNFYFWGITLTNTDSDGSSTQKYSLFLCTTFRRSANNNSHVTNFTFADKIWSDRFRRSILCEILIQRHPQWEVWVGDNVSLLRRPKKKRFRLENQCKHTPRNTKTVHGRFCIQTITKFGAFPPSLYPISLSLSYAFFFSEAVSKLCS